jgi:DNA-binding MarR family transcriptional regulator
MGIVRARSPRNLVGKATRVGPRAKTEMTEQEPVQTIIAQWERERPDLDFEPMTLFAALTRAYLLASSHIDKLMVDRGLTRGMFDVLATLKRAGRPYRLTPKELSASLLLSGAGMTNRLDRLEALGLVSRMPEPSDRRSLHIELTKKGNNFVDNVLPDLIETQRMAFDIGIEPGRKLMKLLVLMNDRLTRSHKDVDSVLPED